MLKKYRFILWTVAGATVFFLAYLIYQMLQPNTASSGILILVMLLLGLVLGGVIAFLASGSLKAQAPIINESSHTIAESMRKVFKVVSAEGHFNEIYNYEETTKIFNFIPSKKKALVIVQAKVLVGYDFEKFKWEFDEVNKTVKLLNFPAPQILSTETDYGDVHYETSDGYVWKLMYVMSSTKYNKFAAFSSNVGYRSSPPKLW